MQFVFNWYSIQAINKQSWLPWKAFISNEKEMALLNQSTGFILDALATVELLGDKQLIEAALKVSKLMASVVDRTINSSLNEASSEFIDATHELTELMRKQLGIQDPSAPLDLYRVNHPRESVG